MKRTMMLSLSVAAALTFATPMHAQDAPAAVNDATALCSLQLAGVEATDEQIAAFQAQAEEISAKSAEFLATYSEAALVEACPVQAELFAAAFDFARLGQNASQWTAEDQRVATVQSNALAIGFETAQDLATTAGTGTTTLTATGESCTAQCKRERDQCLKDDGCTGGWPCFCCVPCNVTWMACLADCCLPG